MQDEIDCDGENDLDDFDYRYNDDSKGILSITSFKIPDTCVLGSVACADVNEDDPLGQDGDLTYPHVEQGGSINQDESDTINPEDETVKVMNTTEEYLHYADDTVNRRTSEIRNNLNQSIFYDDPRMKIDPGAGCSVTNLLHALRDVKFFDHKFKCNVRMHGATSKKCITPTAVGKIRVPANIIDGYIDVRCYYSPLFTSSLLSDNDVLRAAGGGKKGEYYKCKLEKFFAPNEEKLDEDLKYCKADPTKVDYHYNYGDCMLVCKHDKKQNRTFSVPGIIKSGLCYTHPIIIPEYSADDPQATEFNSPEHISLLEVLESLPRDYAKFPSYHTMISQVTPINALNKEAEALLWHQRIGHAGPHIFKDLHTHVNGIPDLLHFKFDDLTKCNTCMKGKLSKVPPGDSSSRERERERERNSTLPRFVH